MKALLLLTLLPAVAWAAPQVLIDTDFGVPGERFEDINAESGNRITGALPAPWKENTGWKKNVVISYEPVEEGGRRFLRIVQKSGEGAQFSHDLPGVEKEPGYYRLTLTARSLTGGSLSMRFIGAPYSTIWSDAPAMTEEWGDFSYDFRLSPQPQPLGLYFYLSADGTLDVEKLKLVKLSEEDLIAELKARYPEAAQGNLVRISRFPLGLQSGWSIDRDYSDGDQVQIESDAQVKGPSGSSALRVTAADGLRLFTAPFPVPWSFEQHVVSLYVRGEWDGALQVFGGTMQPLAAKPLKATGTEWQRVELPFKPVLMGKSHTLRIEGKGTLWLDGLQVERGTAATGYAPQMAVEVSLACPASPAAAARVQFADEPATVAYGTTGECGGGVLKARIVNMYGAEKRLPPVKLAAGFLNQGTLKYGVFPAQPYGPHRIEAWVEDAAGTRVSTFNELVVYRLRRPRYWGKDAADSAFGTHTLSTTRHNLMAKAAGCNWVRLHDAGTEYIGWSSLEPEQGKWQFRDAEIQRYRKYNLKVLGLFSTAPGWATNLGKPATGYFDRYLEPKDVNDFANYVRVVGERYRGVIDTYEIWNEPWGSAFWSLRYDPNHGASYLEHYLPSETPAEDYAKLQAAAYAAAKKLTEPVKILGFNTYGSESGEKWTREVLGFGGLDTCDVVSYHHYASDVMGMTGDSGVKAYEYAVKPIVEKLGRVPKPVWMSEGDPQAGDTSNGLYRYTLPYENTEDVWRLSDRLARYVVSHRATGEAKAFLYTMHGHSHFGGPMQWSVLITGDGYLHPSAAAHSTMAWLLEDLKIAQVTDLAEGVHIYFFSGAGRSVAVISPAPKHAAWRLPASPDVQRLDLLGNPVAAGTALGSNIVYVAASDMTRLKQALNVK